MEFVRSTSRGGFSVRSIVTFVLTVVITALLWATVPSATSQALGNDVDDTANWQGGGSTLLYDKHGYNETSELKDPSGTIPADATVYQSPVQNSGQSSTSQKVFIIYFSSGVDPPTATSAKYVEFDYKNGAISNPQNQRDIKVTPQSADGNSGSSCSVSGIGWIICPVSVFLADAMDNIFNILSNMIKVQPLVLGDANNSMFVAWNIMRSIANIAFVIAFLIIIYAQLTNMGVSNYGLKKLIPRLIIAAVLVNLSYYITALAIDISNILGYSIQEVFNRIREDTFHLTNDNVSGFSESNWSTVTAVVLGTGGLIGGVYYVAAGGLYLLLPVLLGLLLTIIFVVVILAARQAILVILVIIAPLAFVANLLPNTEKWFDKWKDLFFTMLIFFPAFSLVFGGSQLAGQIIIQNAGDDIVMLIFGMAVQIAPLVITPLLLKLSGSLLGRIAQITNNPRKGIIDRNRNWAQSRAEHAKYQNIKRGMTGPDGNAKRRFNPTALGSGMVKRMDSRKRSLSDNTDIWKQEVTNDYETSKKYAGKGGIYERKSAADIDKGAIHDAHAAHLEKLKVTPGTRIYNSAMSAQVNKDSLETNQQHTAGYYNMLRTVGGTDLNASNNALEAAKGNASASEQNKEAYLNQMRTFRSTQLGAAAERLEAAKLNAEGMQSTYTTHIDKLKLDPNTTLSNAAVFAQSSKEHSEAAQGRVQAMFDRDRRTEGTSLNASAINLEGAKLEASEAKDLTAVYLNSTKSQLDGVLHVRNAQSEAAKHAVQTSESRLKAVVEEYKAGFIPTNASPELVAAIENISSEQQAGSIEGARASNAQKVQNERLADALINSSDLRDRAGGINEQGSDAALANSINTVRTAYGASVNEARQIIKHFNLSSSQRQQLALLQAGGSITVQRDDGTSHTFTADDVYAREAAIEDQVAVGTIDQVEEIVMASGKNSLLADYRTTIADALAKNGLGGKSSYLGGKTIDDVGKGRINGREDILALAVETIGKGKISEKDLANIDPIAVGRLLEAAQRIKDGNIPAIVDANLLPGLYDRMIEFSKVARDTLVGEESVSVKTKARPYIEEIGRLGT